MISDRVTRVPSMRLAELHSRHTPETYAYLFTWKSPAGMAASAQATEWSCRSCSATTTSRTRADSSRLSPEVEQLSHRMQDAWVAFARTGSPRTTALPDWEPYAAARRSTMLLDTSCRAVDAPLETERRFWADACT